MNSLSFSELIEAVSKAYDRDGVISDIHQSPDLDHGDGLALFIHDELNDIIGGRAITCDMMDEVCDAMYRALQELESVIVELENINCAMKGSDEADIKELPGGGEAGSEAVNLGSPIPEP